MRTVKELQEFLAKCNPGDSVYAYEGEVSGIVIAYPKTEEQPFSYLQKAFFDNEDAECDELG